MNIAEKSQSQSRLQRQPDFTGAKINQFKQVLIRHGLPILCFSIICLLSSNMRDSLSWGLQRALDNPLYYLLGLIGLLIFFSATALFSSRANRQQFFWVLYLLGISIGEEWVYRLALPGWILSLTADTVEPVLIVVLCNAVFAAVHYFTLRWRMTWCIAVFFGGMGLSRLMLTGDLVLVIFVHWIATYINTSKAPS